MVPMETLEVTSQHAEAGSCGLAAMEPCVLHIATPNTGSCAQLRA